MVAKFHIKLKVQGFELEVDGTREDLPVIREALTQQFAGLIGPGTEIASGELITPPGRAITPPAAIINQRRIKRRSPRSASNGNATAAGAATEQAIDWRHDTTKYGSPKQAWKTAEKAIYVLYVAATEASVSEMTAKQVSETFKKHFRQAGAIRPQNVLRDLGKLKTARSKDEPPLVSQDTTKDPSTWYLNEAGVQAAQQLVREALGQGPSTT